MTFDESALKKYWTIDEAAQRLSENSDESVSREEVLGFALDGHLPLVLYCPTGRRRPTPSGWSGSGLKPPTIKAGLWGLVTEGERGAPARQQIEHERNWRVSVGDITGAWVERDGVQHQLEEVRYESGPEPTVPRTESGYLVTTRCAFE